MESATARISTSGKSRATFQNQQDSQSDVDQFLALHSSHLPPSERHSPRPPTLDRQPSSGSLPRVAMTLVSFPVPSPSLRPWPHLSWLTWSLHSTQEPPPGFCSPSLSSHLAWECPTSPSLSPLPSERQIGWLWMVNRDTVGMILDREWIPMMILPDRSDSILLFSSLNIGAF